jgi:hypothetical protein
MPVEDDPEHVVDLALLVVGRREQVRDAGHVGLVGGNPQLEADAVDGPHVEHLVVHAEARLLREVVDTVQRGEEGVALADDVFDRVADVGRLDHDGGLSAVVDGVEDRLRPQVAQLAGEQLEAGGVRHRRPCSSR